MNINNRDNKSKELKIISDEVVDFINTHQDRHDVSDEYKNTSVFENIKDEKKVNMTMYVFDKTKVNNNTLGYNSSLAINIDPTYDKKVKFSNDDTMLNKKTSQELTEKLYRRAVESLATEPVDKKKKRIKRPGKTFGKNKGARK